MENKGFVMNREELCRYNEAQREQIMIYKWIESEKKKNDIGYNNAAREWISKYGHQFRNWWDMR